MSSNYLYFLTIFDIFLCFYIFYIILYFDGFFLSKRDLPAVHLTVKWTILQNNRKKEHSFNKKAPCITLQITL